MFFKFITFFALLGVFARTGVDFGLIYLAIYGNYVLFLCLVFSQMAGLNVPVLRQGVLIIYDNNLPVIPSVLFLARLWFVAGKVLNRLMHALNGNIFSITVSKALLMPFLVLFAVFFMVDLLTGFQFGYMGYFRIVSTTSRGRFQRCWQGCGRILRKFTILMPLYIVVIALSPPVFILFVIYDVVAVIVLTFWPEKNTLHSDDPNFERRVRLVNYGYTHGPDNVEPWIQDNAPVSRPYAGKNPRVRKTSPTPPEMEHPPSDGTRVTVSQPAIVEATASGEFSMTGPAIARRKDSVGSETTVTEGSSGRNAWATGYGEHVEQRD